jgi:hypothetical protein
LCLTNHCCDRAITRGTLNEVATVEIFPLQCHEQITPRNCAAIGGYGIEMHIRADHSATQCLCGLR